MRKFLAPLIVFACAVGGAGCGGDEARDARTAVGTTPPVGGATGTTGATNTGVPQIPPPAGSGGSAGAAGDDGAGGSSPESSGSTESGAVPRAGSARSRRVLRHIRRNFTGGDTPGGGWARYVEQVSVTGNTTRVDTDLSDDPAGNRIARQICASLRGAIPGLTDVVRVSGTAQRTLARCVP